MGRGRSRKFEFTTKFNQFFKDSVLLSTILSHHPIRTHCINKDNTSQYCHLQKLPLLGNLVPIFFELSL